MGLPSIAGPGARKVASEFAKWMAGYLAGKQLDNMLRTGIGLTNPQAGEFNPSSMGTQELMDAFFFGTPGQELTAQERIDADRALNYFANNSASLDDIANYVDALDLGLTPEGEDLLKMMDPLQKEVLKRLGLSDQFDFDNTDPEARRVARRTKRRSGDGKRVSREFHEYTYCKESGQIAKIYEIGDVDIQAPPTYGTFVDAVLMRKAIAKYRKLRNLAYGKGSQSIASILGTTREAFLVALFNQGTFQAECSDAAEDFNDRLD